jgi:hypothetical protein
MIELLKLEKNSFTLFETLISIFLLSVIIISFSKGSFYDNFDEEFMHLNSIENSFTIDSYNTNFETTSKNIKIIINGIQEKNVSVKLRKYSDEKIKIYKYEI